MIQILIPLLKVFKKINTINNKIARYQKSGKPLPRNLNTLLKKAEQQGLTTKSGRLTKSKKIFNENTKYQKILKQYESDTDTTPVQQEQNNYKEDFNSLISERLTPSEVWQIHRKSTSPKDFADRIYWAIEAEVQTVFEDSDYKERFLSYVVNTVYVTGI